VTACAVVAMETPEGPEPCAVLACRGRGEQAAAAIENANAHLAEFQRVRRWVLWPEPDLPRTSTGEVRRKAVAEWLKKVHAAASTPGTHVGNGNGNGHGPGAWTGNGRAGAPGGGHGLAGMAERATAFGGTLSAGPRPAGGWEVAATLRDCKAPAPA